MWGFFCYFCTTKYFQMKKIYFLLLALGLFTSVNAQAPVAVNDNFSQPLIEDGANGTIEILLNDTDPDGNPTPTSGHVVDLDIAEPGIQNNYSYYYYGPNYFASYDVNTGIVTINPGENVHGSFSFQYNLIDNINPNLSCIATVSFSVTSVIDPVTANNDDIYKMYPTCNDFYGYNILQNDFAEDGINNLSVDLDPEVAGIQNSFDLIVNQEFIGRFEVNYGNIIFQIYTSNYIPDGTIYTVNYTYQDTLGVTSNSATCNFVIYSPQGYSYSTNPTCDNINGGSISVNSYDVTDFYFDLFRNNVFYDSYSSTNGTHM